jgi:hypothetical protein
VLLRLIRATRQWLRAKLHRPRPLRTQYHEELPDDLRPGVVYVLGENRFRWSVATLCPCGCGAVLQMSVMQEGRPRWQLHEHEDGTISLHPSVWRKEGCRSHFFLRRGKVVWCTASADGAPAPV